MHTTFPATRLRRPRRTAWLRDMVAETVLTPQDLILPLFVHGGDAAEAVASLPGVSRLPIAGVVAQAKEALALGIPAIALFPVTDPALKTTDGAEALNADNLICQTIAQVKAAVPEIGIIADVALDPYTNHGHDGVLDGRGDVDNDATLRLLARQAVLLAAAGADIVAPSDMMDGRVAAIRTALEQAGYAETMILAYSAKYASSFYGPFRDAVGSATALGKADKRSYQMNPANGAEALREAAMDVAEGADMLMVKPALPYLDILYRIKQAQPGVPLLAYHVSGEYAALCLAAEKGLLDYDAALYESLIAIKRAGADAMVTYGALCIAKNLS